MSGSVRNLSVEVSSIIKEIKPRASAIENSQVWPKGKKMVLVCIVRQTEYFIIFLLLGPQLSQNASKSWRLQENPVPSIAEHRTGIRWGGFLPVELSLVSGSTWAGHKQPLLPAVEASTAPLLGELWATFPLLSAGAVLLEKHSHPNKDKFRMISACTVPVHV